MKIISGKYKGRNIFISNDKSLQIRPTMTKIRMALFNIIYSGKFFTNFEDAIKDFVILDLSCGYGSLGIEALSRGAKFCYFLDKNPIALDLVSKTLEKFGANSQAKLLNARIENLPFAETSCDLIFIDPPYIYKSSQLSQIIEDLEAKNWTNDNSIIAIESKAKDKNTSYNFSKFDVMLDRSYGNTKIIILQKNALKHN